MTSRDPTPIPDRFRIVDTIAESDAEKLVQAYDSLLEREVWLNVPKSARLAFSADGKRELREAKMLARVRHPDVMRLLDVLATAHGLILVIEPTAGEPLRSLLDREGSLPPERVRQIGIRLCNALSAVHHEGVVHRGVSARSVLLRADDSLCLTGFAFAKPGSGPLGMSSIDYRSKDEGARKPIPAHPAPEQVSGMPADARSDVYAVGCVLFELVTGRVLTDSQPDSDSLEAVPADLATVVRKCTALNPLGRYQTADQAREALESPQSVHRSAMRVWIGIAAGVLVGALGVTLALQMTGSPSRGEPARRDETRRANNPEELLPSYERSFALLIGIGEAYGGRHVQLQNPARDVDAIRTQLEDMKWEKWNVRTLLEQDATAERIRDSVAKIASEAKRNDRVLIYFAGHGELDRYAPKTVAYIVPADGRSKESDPTGSTWINMSLLTGQFEETRAKHMLIALDCCYSGTATPPLRSSRGYRDTYLTQRAHVVLASSRRDRPAYDGNGQLSPFAKAFVDALKRRSDVITVRDIEALARERLRQLGQLPVLCYFTPPANGGDYVFFLEPPRNK